MTFPRIDAHRSARFGAVTWLLALVVASGPARAAGSDPLQSDECVRAVASLQREESAEAARRASDTTARSARPTPSAALQDARRDAAKRCLASRADVEPPRGRFAQAPIVVEPIVPVTPSAALASSHALVPSPSIGRVAPVPVKTPGAVTSCDSGGCWASDGSRLPRVGPVLWGPRGACTVQGASLQCP